METSPNLGFTISIKTLNSGVKPYHYVLVEHPDKDYVDNRSMDGVATFCTSSCREAVELEATKLAKLLGVPLDNIQRIIVS